MCIVTEKGYEFECSKRIIPFDGVTVELLSSLSEEEFSELKNSTVNLLSQIQMKSSITTLEGKIDGMSSSLNRAIKESLEVQKKLELDHKNCPVNKGSILDVVDEWWIETAKNIADPNHDLGKRFTARIVKDLKQFLKDTFLNTGALARAGIAIAVALAGFSALVYGMMKLAQ